MVLITKAYMEKRGRGSGEGKGGEGRERKRRGRERGQEWDGKSGLERVSM